MSQGPGDTLGTRISDVGFCTWAGSPDMVEMSATLTMAERLGADVVELSLADEDIVVGCKIIPDRLRRLKDIIKNHALRYTVHGPGYVNFMATDDFDRNKRLCRTFLELCGEIGAKSMIMHTGYCMHDDEAVTEDCYAQQRDAFHEMGEVARSYGVTICVENIYDYAEGMRTASPTKLANEIREIGHPNVVATLDFGHAAIQCTIDQLDYVKECRAMAPQVRHLHVHDNFGLPPNYNNLARGAEAAAFGYDDLHLPIGYGDNMHWEEVLPDMAVMDGTTMILELRMPEYTHALEESLAKARQFAMLINGTTERTGA